MSIASEIQRIETNIASAYASCESKGATLPSIQNSENLATTIQGIPSGSGEIWSRPSGWIDMDKLPLEDCAYYSIDCRDYNIVYNKTGEYKQIKFFAKSIPSSANCILELGHLDGTSFVTEETWSITSSYTINLPVDRDFALYRIKAESNANLNYFGLKDILQTNDSKGIKICEIYCDLPYHNINSIYGDFEQNIQANTTFDNCNTKHIKINLGTNSKVYDFSSLFTNAYSLECVEMDISSSSGQVKTLQGMFQGCSALTKAILNWNTSTWVVTNISRMFYECYSMTDIELNWDTSNWAVTSMVELFYGCRSLQKVTLNWNTSNWAVTSMASLFQNCTSLIDIELNWNTSNWAVTSIGTMFYSCRSLQKAILNWDTSNWVVTSMNNMFGYNQSLYYLDLSTWNVTNWSVTSFGTMFIYDISLKFLKPPITWWKLESTINTSTDMSRDSLLAIFNSLPSVSSPINFRVTNANLSKLTAEEKAIATNKGWTLS